MEKDSQVQPEQEKLIQQLEAHYDRGRFLDLMREAEKRLGDYRQWRSPRLVVLAARTLRQLGLGREADALILRAWRRKKSIALTSAYLHTLQRRQGPLVAWNTSQKLLPLVKGDAREHAHVLLCQVDIVTAYRDFSLAENLLSQAQEIYSSAWVELSVAYLYLDEDKYEKAYETVQQVLERFPRYRPAIQLMAHLQQLQGQLDEAINTLQQYLTDMQCYSLCFQLFQFYIEKKNYAQAEHCIAHLEKILWLKTDVITKEINQIRADLLCAQQRYEEALPLLETKNFFQKSVSKRIRTQDKNGKRKVLDVPFVRQHHMTCAPASLSAVSTYWEKPVSQAVVVDEICYDGTPAVDERRWAEKQGWFTVEFELQFETARQLIEKGIPILLSTVEPGAAHLQVLVGYDESMGTYLLRDPYYPRLQEMLIEASEKYYASNGPRCMIILPAEKQALLSDIQLGARQLYDQYFLLKSALDTHQRTEAFNVLRRMVKHAPEHRLTLWAKLDIAYYDQDDRGILKSSEQLLEKYPDDVNLQLTKINAQAAIGSSEEQVAYLESLAAKENCHFLIRWRLIEAIRFDHRQLQRVGKNLQELLRRNPVHAPALYAYAGLLWDQGSFKDSYLLYRFVTCLEDKNERYAMSYFTAARYHREAETAQSFLQDRFQRFGKKSSGPVISLFNAFDATGQTQKGLEQLEAAIEMRPEDGELMLFAARQYLNHGQLGKSIQIAKKAKAFTHQMRFYELAALVRERQQKRDEAIACWQKVLSYEPLNASANNAMIQLLIEAGTRDKAIDFIDSQIKKFPQNYHVLRLKIHALRDDDYPGLVNAYRSFINSHPGESWAYVGLAQTLLAQGEFTQAEQHARQGIDVDQNNAEAYTLLGQIHIATQSVGAAKEAFHKAIQLSCDHTEAFEPLLQCALDDSAQREELAFIQQQLMSQVTYGAGVLHFQYLAKRWLQAEEISQFMFQAVEERPDLWQTWQALGFAYRDQGLLDKALNTLDTAIKRFPLIPELHFEKAELFRLMNRLEDAETVLEETLQLSPDWTRAANLLSDIYEMQGKFDAAIACLQTMISRSPLGSTTHGYLASLLWRVGRKSAAFDEMLIAVDLSPLYVWAWDQLNEWAVELKRTEEVQKRIVDAREKMPNSWQLLSIHARLLHDRIEARNLLRAYLDNYPHAVEICTDYVKILVESDDYQTALLYSSTQYWNNTVPVEITALHAWVLKRQGDIREAVQTMHSVVEKNPNYYDGWRLLANWYEELGESVKVIECVHHCKALYPNDAGVLCFVAEKLQDHDQSRSAEVESLLKKAFFLDPMDRYTGLTYIDLLLENKRFELARAALDLLRLHVNDAYVYFRELQLAHEHNETDKLLQMWEKLLLDGEANNYLLSHSWKLIKAQHCTETALSTLRSLYDRELPVTPLAGEYLAYGYEDGKRIKALEKNLLTITVHDAFFHRMVEGYLRLLIKQEQKISKKVMQQLDSQLRSDTVNWGLVGYIHVEQGHWYAVVDWMSDYRQHSELEAWMLYLYSLALRQTGNWQSGVDVMSVAFTLEPDLYREDIIIWHMLDSLSAGAAVDTSLIDNVDQDNLAGLTRYPFAILKALLSLNSRGFVEAYRQISPLLREAQRQYQAVVGSRAAETVKGAAKLYLKNTIQEPFFAQLYWQWKLSIHF